VVPRHAKYLNEDLASPKLDSATVAAFVISDARTSRVKLLVRHLGIFNSACYH
jgi:hypothetical protein